LFDKSLSPFISVDLRLKGSISYLVARISDDK
jgi:hypothetical protein